MVTNWERAIKLQLINALLPYLNDFFATKNKTSRATIFIVKKAKFPKILLYILFGVIITIAVINNVRAKKRDSNWNDVNLFLFIAKFISSSTWLYVKMINIYNITFISLINKCVNIIGS